MIDPIIKITSFDDIANAIIPIEAKSEALEKCEERKHEPISPRIQKQISLFEKDGRSNTIECDRRPLSPPLIPNRRKKFENLESFFMSQSSTNTNLYSYNKQREVFSSHSSCSNLKILTPSSSKSSISSMHKPQPNSVHIQDTPYHHPGALVVKQIFIDPPKRITRSFGHSKTKSVDCDFHFYDTHDRINSGDIGSSNISSQDISVRTSPKLSKRFTTSKIRETLNPKDDHC